MTRPWWWRPARDDDEGERIVGEPGDGRILMVTRRDDQGYPVERAWVAPADADQYDETRWGPLSR
ncbi:hypothetical protein [Compostimonas suwonensis]|uniref:Uncharacterized protein n=1 Tax=Compostimonas suwonensis TaxID=1048394 RepID=A0A2M9BW46_9MICO|nr:hypothetical protein [Compostimonas suwonensis]PJJ62177.1 hypothetical protein CLV54_1974 [Compostimonas suwonensis]